MAERIIRPRLTAREAECLYHAMQWVLEDSEGCDIFEWLGGEERVKAALSGAEKLHRAVYGPPQSDDEEGVEARYQARKARRDRKG